MARALSVLSLGRRLHLDVLLSVDKVLLCHLLLSLCSPGSAFKQLIVVVIKDCLVEDH